MYFPVYSSQCTPPIVLPYVYFPVYSSRRAPLPVLLFMYSSLCTPRLPVRLPVYSCPCKVELRYPVSHERIAAAKNVCAYAAQVAVELYQMEAIGGG